MRRLLLSALVLVMLMSVGPQAFAAATGGSPEAEPTRIEVPMVVTGKAVATDNGYSVEPLTGVEAAQQNDNCGTSYVDIEPRSGGFDLYTGFTVIVPAISYSWSARVLGPAYDDGTFWGGGLLNRSRWDGQWLGRQVDFSGDYSALADGFAILNNGLVCSSTNPTDATYIFS